MPLDEALIGRPNLVITGIDLDQYRARSHSRNLNWLRGCQ